MKTVFVFPLKNITLLTKIKLNFGGILIVCNDKASEFTSFLNRDKVFSILETCYKASQSSDDIQINPNILEGQDEEEDTEESELDEIDMQLFSKDDNPDAGFLQSPETAFKELGKEEIFSVPVFKFFKIFWSDDTFSLRYLHQRNDTEIDIQAWKNDPNLGFVRQLTYRTPLNQPLGPSSCRVEETQRYFLSKTKLLLEVVNVFSGIPYGDCFHVEKKWEIISGTEKNTCKVRAWVAVHWIKKPRLLAGTIENGTVKETVEVYNQWISLAKDHLQNRKMLKSRHPEVDQNDEDSTSQKPPQDQSAPSKTPPLEQKPGIFSKIKELTASPTTLLVILSALLLITLQYFFSPIDRESSPYIAVLIGFGILVYQIESLNYRIAQMEIVVRAERKLQ